MSLVEDVGRTAFALMQACWDDTGDDLTASGDGSWAVHVSLYRDLQRYAARNDHTVYATPTGPKRVVTPVNPDKAGDRRKRASSVELIGLPVYPDPDLPPNHLELRWARRKAIR